MKPEVRLTLHAAAIALLRRWQPVISHAQEYGHLIDVLHVSESALTVCFAADAAGHRYAMWVTLAWDHFQQAVTPSIWKQMIDRAAKQVIKESGDT